MEPLILQTASEDAGKRLDAWLAEQTELTRSAVQKLMEEGRVTAAGKPLAKNTRLTGGETVSVDLPEAEEADIVPQDIPLDVVYEDEDVIVVNKPVGHGGAPRAGTPGRHAGQRPAVPLRGQPLRYRRREAARHRPPHRPGHLAA